MKLSAIVLLVAALFAVTAFAQIIGPDDTRLFLDRFEGGQDRNFPDAFTESFVENDIGIQGGAREVFVTGTKITTRVLGDTQVNIDENFLLFNVPASVTGDLVLFYDGAQATAVAPCGGGDIAGTCNQPLASNAGINLDVSRFSGIGFTVRRLDQANGVSFSLRFWFSDGSTEVETRQGYPEVEDDTGKPLVFFAFSAFGTQARFQQPLRAVAIQINGLTEAVDLVVGPPQFTGVGFTKTVNTPTAPIDSLLTYTVTIENPAFVVPDVTDTVNTTVIGLDTAAIFTDTLPTNLEFVQVVSVLDGNGVAPIFLPDTEFGFNLTTRQLTASFRSDVDVSITLIYTARIVGTFLSCSNQVCNNAFLDVTTVPFLPPGSSDIISRTRTAQACVTTTTQPTITVTSTSCGTFQNPTSTYLVSNGNTGRADSVTFELPRFSSLTSGCELQSISANGNVLTCNNDNDDDNDGDNDLCTFSLGDLIEGQSVPVSVSYVCRQRVCAQFSDNVRPIVRNICDPAEAVGVVCPLPNNPSINLDVSEVLDCRQTANNCSGIRPGDTIGSTITITNTGASDADVVIVTRTYDQFVTPTTATNAMWSCNTNTRICTRTENNIGVTARVLSFGVVVNQNFPINQDFAQSEVTATVDTTIGVCMSSDQDTLFAPVQAGRPDIGLAKTAVTTQYTFVISYDSNGDGAATSVRFTETLQSGWTLSQRSTEAGWICNGATCTITLPSLAPGATGEVLFIVDVAPSAQNNNQMCWVNTATVTYDDIISTSDPAGRTATSRPIGSFCTGCDASCNLECDPVTFTPVTVGCPALVECNFVVPEMWCPVCIKTQPVCPCDQCPTDVPLVIGEVFVGQPLPTTTPTMAATTTTSTMAATTTTEEEEEDNSNMKK